MPIKTGRDPAQFGLFATPLEAMIADTAEVRVIAAFVDQLDLDDLGFNKINTQDAIFQSVGVPILATAWDNNLIGSAVTIKTTETDETSIRVTSATTTSQDTRDIDADFGIKIPISTLIGSDTVGIGVETQHQNTKQYTLAYPGDIDINTVQIFYHNPLIIDLGSEVFGYSVNRYVVPPGSTNRDGTPMEPGERSIEIDACTTLDTN